MYVPKINKVLKNQIETYIKTKDTVYVRSGELYGVLMELYTTTGTAWAYQTRGLLKKDGGQMGFSERVVSIMRQIFEFELLETAENITQTTIRLIQEVLSDAALEGWSFDEIVKKLVSPDMTAKRARLIARTETVNAANAGSLANLKAAGATKKIWIAARDNRTRDHHREVNQTVIGIDELFKVGDSEMQHPGDKSGSAAEVCNCRCAVAGVVDDEIKIEDVIMEHKRQIEPLMDMVAIFKKFLEVET
jgi:SPP1 gp7 family putative phage head morphogenesis protein